MKLSLGECNGAEKFEFSDAFIKWIGLDEQTECNDPARAMITEQSVHVARVQVVVQRGRT